MKLAAHRANMQHDAAAGTGSVLFFDTFNRVDDASSLGTSNSGHAWSNAAGTHGISSLHAYAPTTTVGDNRALVESGKSGGNYTVAANFRISSTAGRTSSGLIFRGVDASNFLLCNIFDQAGGSPDTVELFRCVSGAYTSLATSFSLVGFFSAGTTYNLEIICSGTSIQAYVNGVLRTSATSSVHQTATKVGLRTFRSASTNDDGTARWAQMQVI